MAGLFDFLASEDPKQAAYNAMMFGLLSGKGTFNQRLGQAGMSAMEQSRTAQEAKARQQQRSLQQQMLQMEMSELERKRQEALDMQRRTQEAIAAFPQAGVVQGPPTEGGDYAIRNPTENDYMTWGMNAYGLNPGLAQFGFKAAEGITSREDRQEAAREAQKAAQAAALERERLKAEAAMERDRERADQRESLARITAAMRPPREEPAPVAVIGPDGVPKYVPRSQAVGKTPAGMGVSLSPKEMQNREAAYPKALTAVKTFDQKSDELLKDLETLKKHPGLPQITGIAAGRLPGITAEGRAAQALYDKIVARGQFQELQDMRQSSPTGGALGNVSNMEGQTLRAAFAALDRRQDAPDVQAVIADTQDKVKNAKKNVKDAFDLTYEYKSGAPAVPELPSLDAIEAELKRRGR